MNELTFLDLAILHRIDEDTCIEKFGSKINTSFFETANLMGTMKIKKLIEFEQSIGGNSKVSIASKGKYVLEVAEKKSKEGLDNLDSAILESISKGESKLDALRGDINIRSEDLAFHLEKLYVQSYIDYYIRSSELYLTLTENGFNEIGSVKKKEKSKDIEETIDETEKPEEKYESKMQEEMPENESIQTKLTNIEESDEDMMTKRVRTKREHYWGKYKIYYFLAIILILIVLGLIYFFLMG